MDWEQLVALARTKPEQWRQLPFKTKEAKKVFDKVCAYLGSYFSLPQTHELLCALPLTDAQFWLSQREFTCNLDTKNVAAPLIWRPVYSWVVATEDEIVYRKLKEQQIPAQFIDSTHAIDAIEHYDVIRAYNCEQFAWALERMPQCIFIKSLTHAAPELVLREFAKKKQLILFAAEQLRLPIPAAMQTVQELLQASSLLDQSIAKKIDKKELELQVHVLNKRLLSEMESVQLNGSAILLLMQKKQLPDAVYALMDRLIIEASLPRELIVREIPLEIDEELLKERLAEQSTDSNRALALQLQSHAALITKLPQLLADLEIYLCAADLVQGIAAFIRDNGCKLWQSSGTLGITDARNLFLSNPQPISFSLTSEQTASILTGDNSGGKTTLLEHLMQLVSLQYLQLPMPGSVSLPAYTSVYYFAKNKGSTNKGAFETLLLQLATIVVDGPTLLLADEMEAVTEPAVASKIMASTLRFFIEKKCHIVFATHLGAILLEHQPSGSRIDGIEAVGLDENDELIVNHNPVLGKLAKSTPELIVQRLAKRKNEYLTHLASSIS